MSSVNRPLAVVRPRTQSPSRLPAPALILAMVTALLGALPGCAWQNAENRLLWNAFEAHWVPEDEPAFSCALPLTIPGGLLAILIDVAVVHPISVVDDAFDASLTSWEDLDWQGEYWYEAGVAPIRGLATGIEFVFQLVGRAVFDVPAFDETERADEPFPSAPARTSSTDAPAALDADQIAVERALHRAWLQDLLRGDPRRGPSPAAGQLSPAVWDDELQALAERVLSEALYRERIAYHSWASRYGPPGYEALWLGLVDSDPRVRGAMLMLLGKAITIPGELRQALLHDPDPVVAELAWQLLANQH